MFYTIYKTTNLINGKIYIGKHKTQDLDDNYLGSGKVLTYAINKHGENNFTKEYLFIFDNEEDMNNKELELVNESFIKEDTNYNIKLGGEGGWDYINNREDAAYYRKRATDKYVELMKDDDFRNNFIQAIKDEYASRCKDKKLLQNKKNSEALKEYYKFNDGAFKGKKHTEETKELMRKPKNVGKDNSQYGKMWIYSLEEKISKRISKNEAIPEGWYKGRKMKF